MFKIHSFKLSVSRFALLCAAFALAGSTLAAANQDAFATATPVDLNATLRGRGGAGETRVLRLDVPAAGIISVDLSVPGGARAAPRIGLVDPESRAVLIEHAAGRLSFAVPTPGTYYLRAGAQDPRQALGDFKVRTAFVETETVDQELTIVIGGREVRIRKTDFFARSQLTKTEEVEIDPNPALYDPDQDGLLLTHATFARAAVKTEEVEIDPNPVRTSPAGSTPDRLDAVLLYGAAAKLSAKTEEVEIDPNPMILGPAEVRGLDRVVTALVTTFTGDEDLRKTEEVEIDPNPVYGGASGRGVLTSTQQVTFYADSPAGGQAGVLRWINEEIWPDGVKRSLNDGRFRLRSYDPTAHGSGLLLPLAGLCRGAGVDDHGDTLPCATRLAAGRTAAGEIDNDAGDDVDVFAFAVTELTTVSLESTLGTDTFGSLYDRFGQRLEQDDDGGDGANFRIVRTLSPGLYFLRVEGGHGAEGPYQVTLEQLEQ